MAVARVKKVRILSHHEAVEQVVAALHKLECCEIIGRDEGKGVASEFLVPCDRSREKGQFGLESSLSDIRFLLRFLEPLYKEEGGKLERLLGPKPPVSFSELASLNSETDLSKITSQARTLERLLAEMRSEIAQISSHSLLLETIRDFSHPMWMISRGTEKVMGVVGTIPVKLAGSLRNAFGEAVAGQGELFFAPFAEKQAETFAILLFSRNLESEVMEIAAQQSFSRIECPQGLEMAPAMEIKRLANRRKELLAGIGKAEKGSLEMAEEWVPMSRKLNDFLTILTARRDTEASGNSTEKVSILRFWVPSDSLEMVKKVLKPFDELVDIHVEDPAPGENPPIILNNPVWAAPFSPLTKLYGMPSYNGIDPTVLMAPFFFLFFGMCLGDGGYGLIMGAFFLYALLRFRMSGDKKKFFLLLFLASISTIFIGAITGSWLGDMVDTFGIFSFIRPLKDSVVLLKPMSDPITFLVISLALGVVQILFGILIAMWDAFRKGDIVGALGDHGGWFSIIVGLLVWGASSFGIGGYSALIVGKSLAALGVLTLVLTQGRDKPGFARKAISGVLSLYNVTSYLGDVLSYSRLLALGLATSAIAMIVNTLTVLVSGIPYVGWILAGLIFFGGHLFSIVVNILGAFIHSLRLQYVEFFSKFYSGGGRIFSPLRFDTKYTRITDAGSNE
ncbi:MAG: V-type ATP synthase subunit I [Thermovirgaceae bacterium]|nr:V-type ATP synthase subunit I [Thermovirgaceae bacterium]